jgi:hypothetical protein
MKSGRGADHGVAVLREFLEEVGDADPRAVVLGHERLVDRDRVDVDDRGVLAHGAVDLVDVDRAPLARRRLHHEVDPRGVLGEGDRAVAAAERLLRAVEVVEDLPRGTGEALVDDLLVLTTSHPARRVEEKPRGRIGDAQLDGFRRNAERFSRRLLLDGIRFVTVLAMRDRCGL